MAGSTVSESIGTSGVSKRGDAPVGSPPRRRERLVGTSRAVQRASEQISVAGRGGFPVLITGEEGVDKELVARLIHNESEWASGDFFALDASLVPETLLGRELFGSEAGAIASLPAGDGAFRRMAEGTVLLENVEAMPKDLQQALATALEEARFRRLGGSESSPLECRLIASSNDSLESLSSTGKLVPDLAERLHLLEIRIPPLRERKEDILPIAANLLATARTEIEEELGRPCGVRGFTREALERLRDHRWPGNERELREQIRSALRLARTEELGPEDLMLGTDATEEVASFRDAKRTFEREYVTRVLKLCHGNISRAARIAKKDRKDFYDVIRRTGVDPAQFR